LRETWIEIIESLETDKLIIGGKSMGGRIASLIADETEVAGLVCLGYTFHPCPYRKLYPNFYCRICVV
jgi:predicted alpha/beta-hydrolase family hydrolase